MRACGLSSRQILTNFLTPDLNDFSILVLVCGDPDWNRAPSAFSVDELRITTRKHKRSCIHFRYNEKTPLRLSETFKDHYRHGGLSSRQTGTPIEMCFLIFHNSSASSQNSLTHSNSKSNSLWRGDIAHKALLSGSPEQASRHNSSLVSDLVPKGDNRSWLWHRSLRPATPKPIGSAPRWLAEFGYQHSSLFRDVNSRSDLTNALTGSRAAESFQLVRGPSNFNHTEGKVNEG